MRYNLLADEVLVKLLQCSDEQAFQVLYRRYARKVFRLAQGKVKNAETAEDITQQVFLGIWERRQQVKIDCMEAYLTTAVKFRCISYFASKYANTAALDPETAVGRADNSTEEAINYEELKLAVYRAMELLPNKTREVFQLSRFHSHSNREIAQLLEISEKAVEYHMTQSLKVMRRELNEYLRPAFPLVALLCGWAERF
jgi:RNA polymerase sigma-70 factor (ECF subfamily)